MKKMRIPQLLSTLAVSLASLSFATAAPSDTACPEVGSCKFKMTTGWASEPLMDVGAKAFAERLKQMSGGRMEIQVFPGGALGNAVKISETVRNGVADMGHMWMGWDWGRNPTTVLFGGYAGSPDTERMLHWLYADGGIELQREFRDKEFDVISMPLFIRPAEVFLHSRKPVRTLEDMKGLKLRTAGAWIEMSAALGASPVMLPGGDVYPALERGVIDATEWGTLWENISPGFAEVTKYVIVPGVHQPTAPYELVINKKVWAKLTPEDQNLIEKVAQLVTFEAYLKVGNEDTKALEYYRSRGNEIIELDPEVQYAARRVADEWADKQASNNEWFKRVLDDQREFRERWAGAERYRDTLIEPGKIQ
ncbi:TRAP transporter substrate-binding protein DctP [Paenalcaligenes niemegkensis]|uniref:TRAP transporter substrate-binding protein DctP n=1 Tax=Paenalcaligenes niemegkensis TaxID=2895469 RepID=UPI001EE970BE|nr:TRAP transporter substrate-binding protein DctP [Paenalcaligenes niemegkensis]MCQ9618188.1 TRAP transporter substrate-binding protein DctP [Paenalcaligenes niemegkensis]